MCRKALFTTEEDDGPMAPDAVRRDQATRALRASGLASASTVGTPFPDNAPFSAVETFDDSIPLDHRRQLMQSAARALELVTWNFIPHTTGTIRFQARSLGPNLVAMANMLKHMAFQQARPRPYASAGNPWAQIVVAVWQILSPKQGMALDALVVPGIVMADLRRRFAAQMDSPVGLFFRDEAAAADLDMLLAMLVSEARQEYLREIGIQLETAPRATSRASGVFSRMAHPRSRSPEGSATRSGHSDTLNHGHADARCAVM